MLTDLRHATAPACASSSVLKNPYLSLRVGPGGVLVNSSHIRDNQTTPEARSCGATTRGTLYKVGSFSYLSHIVYVQTCLKPVFRVFLAICKGADPLL